MKTLEMAKATAPLADYAKDAAKGPVIVTLHGRPIAALMPIENADRETVSLSTNPRFLGLIERSRSRHANEGGISSEEMRRRLQAKRPVAAPKGGTAARRRAR